MAVIVEIGEISDDHPMVVAADLGQSANGERNRGALAARMALRKNGAMTSLETSARRSTKAAKSTAVMPGVPG